MAGIPVEKAPPLYLGRGSHFCAWGSSATEKMEKDLAKKIWQHDKA